MALKISNSYSSNLSSSISATTTEIEVDSTVGFPALVAADNDFANLSIEDENGNIEVVKVTAVTGNDLTVERGIEGTPRQFRQGSLVGLRNDILTIKTLIREIAKEEAAQIDPQDEQTIITTVENFAQNQLRTEIQRLVKSFARTDNTDKIQYNTDIQPPSTLNSEGPSDITDSNTELMVINRNSDQVKRVSQGAYKESLSQDIVEPWANPENPNTPIPASKLSNAPQGSTASGLQSVATDNTLKGTGQTTSVLGIADSELKKIDEAYDGVRAESGLRTFTSIPNVEGDNVYAYRFEGSQSATVPNRFHGQLDPILPRVPTFTVGTNVYSIVQFQSDPNSLLLYIAGNPADVATLDNNEIDIAPLNDVDFDFIDPQGNSHKVRFRDVISDFTSSQPRYWPDRDGSYTQAYYIFNWNVNFQIQDNWSFKVLLEKPFQSGYSIPKDGTANQLLVPKTNGVEWKNTNDAIPDSTLEFGKLDLTTETKKTNARTALGAASSNTVSYNDDADDLTHPTKLVSLQRASARDWEAAYDNNTGEWQANDIPITTLNNVEITGDLIYAPVGDSGTSGIDRGKFSFTTSASTGTVLFPGKTIASLEIKVGSANAFNVPVEVDTSINRRAFISTTALTQNPNDLIPQGAGTVTDVVGMINIVFTDGSKAFDEGLTQKVLDKENAQKFVREQRVKSITKTGGTLTIINVDAQGNESTITYTQAAAGGGHSDDQVEDLAGNLIANLPQFTYNAATDTLTFSLRTQDIPNGFIDPDSFNQAAQNITAIKTLLGIKEPTPAPNLAPYVRLPIANEYNPRITNPKFIVEGLTPAAEDDQSTNWQTSGAGNTLHYFIQLSDNRQIQFYPSNFHFSVLRGRVAFFGTTNQKASVEWIKINEVAYHLTTDGDGNRVSAVQVGNAELPPTQNSATYNIFDAFDNAEFQSEITADPYYANTEDIGEIAGLKTVASQGVTDLDDLRNSRTQIELYRPVTGNPVSVTFPRVNTLAPPNYARFGTHDFDLSPTIHCRYYYIDDIRSNRRGSYRFQFNKSDYAHFLPNQVEIVQSNGQGNALTLCNTLIEVRLFTCMHMLMLRMIQFIEGIIVPLRSISVTLITIITSIRPKKVYSDMQRGIFKSNCLELKESLFGIFIRRIEGCLETSNLIRVTLGLISVWSKYTPELSSIWIQFQETLNCN